MSNYFAFEKNFEESISNHFNSNGLESYVTRSVDHLGANNIQIKFDYSGALDDARQLVMTSSTGVKHQEYDLHSGEFEISVQSYRDENQFHHQRVAIVRMLMLKHKMPLSGSPYQIYDIKPGSAAFLEDEEMNSDITILSYAVHFRIKPDTLQVDV